MISRFFSGLANRVFGIAERQIDPFGDTNREVLPADAGAFIWYFASQAKGPFIVAFIAGGVVGMTDAAMYWALGQLVDILDSAEPATLFADYGWWLAGFLVLVGLVRALVLIGAALIEQQVIVPQFFTRVRWQSFRRVIEQPYGFYQNDFAGRIATKVMQTGESVGDFITVLIQTFWTFVTFVILTVSILTVFDPLMGLAIVAWLAGYVVIGWRLLPRVRRHGRAAADARSVFNGRMVDAFTNIMAVKLFDSGRREHAHVREGLETVLTAVRQLTRAITTVRAAVSILSGIMMVLVGWLALSGWMAGTVSTGEVATALGLTFRLSHMSGWIMFSLNGVIRAYATAQDSAAVIAVEPAIRDRPGALAVEHAKGDIRFQNVSFHYGSDNKVIDRLNLHVRPGEHVALVGPSGAGKTTIVNLALRLFDVEQGSITLDGTDIRDITQASLRAQFGVVSQEPLLMHRSIRDNIGYGRPGAEDEAIREAAVKARADDFIGKVADIRGRRGYDAHVGERGVKLSGGQRQRIAIARMILKDAPVLILDEATASLDSTVEAAIQDSLFDLMQGRTVIAVAHRLSTIAMFDRLVVIDEGRIVEEGRHDVLLARGGLYARLWERQSGGFLAEAV